MSKTDDLWTRQFTEGLRELARAYDRFCVTREIEDFDAADTLHDDLNETYGMSLDLSDFVEIGRVLPVK